MRKQNKATGRDYTYDKAYEASPEQIKARSNRNKARRAMEAKMGHKIPKGMDVDHSNGNPMDNKATNLKMMPKGKNRGKH